MSRRMLAYRVKSVTTGSCPIKVNERKAMPKCEECQGQGITGRQAYKHKLKDGQRLYLCLSHALVWRLQAPDLYPLAYGPEARKALSKAYPPVVASLPMS